MAKENNKKIENIRFNDWQKINLKTGEILDVEEVEGANKLYKLKVDLGTETRTLVAGLKPYYSKEELEGKKCIVFTNLEPRKIKGIESQGMLLAAFNDDQSEVKLLQADGVVDAGWRVG